MDSTESESKFQYGCVSVNWKVKSKMYVIMTKDEKDKNY